MLNVYELERQWFRYKVRFYLPLGVAILSTVLILILGWVFWPSQETSTPKEASNITSKEIAVTPTQVQPQSGMQQPATVPHTIQPSTTVVAQQPPTPVATQSPTIQKQAVMEPSMGFIQSIEVEAQPSPSYESNIVHSERVPETLATIQPDIDRKPSTQAVTVQKATQPILKKEHKSNVSITQKEANDLQDVIKRFSINKNPALSLFLANRYYDMGEYQHAYDYALQTNELDNNVEASWLIFAKSLVKLDKKEQAVKVLTSYINHSRSLRAKALLEDIRTGKFQ